MPGHRRRATRPADGPEERTPVRSRDEDPVGWGDERSEPSEDDDLRRLLADRPPHHDRT